MSAPDYDVFATQCPSRETLEVVTSRWGTLTLAALHEGERLRFGELRRRIDGISDKMLSQTLKQLEARGLVTRTAQDSSAAHVDYALTAEGRTVATAVIALVQSVYRVQPALG
ncbi:helix-turn-helix domain-containing protein [Aeromicrobium sp. Leaf350]|uniref:winged helix-turn-helix transcriptional regulator n=1 Tax=Aeromicrobium sp. Leaf350 TaxID=2876565 RepID=UPI001E63C1C7|nr:helix-turn-helix domain-containing protein [Aeromicrobium sp. Leaf350]